VLSTHEPMCNTGGMPSARHTSPRPGPARSADFGIICPALPWQLPAQPVTSTRMSFSIRRLVSVMWPLSWRIFGLLQPTIPTAPRILPAAMASTSGCGVPPSARRSPRRRSRPSSRLARR